MRLRNLFLLVTFCVPVIGCAAPALKLFTTNNYYYTIEGTKDDRFKMKENVDIYGVYIPAGEYGDVMVFTPQPDGRLAVRHFYLTSASPLPPSELRRAVHMRGIITGDNHYSYGYEISILSLDEITMDTLLPIDARQAIRRAAEDSAYDISQINLNDISIAAEIGYNAGFRIPTDRFKGKDLEFAFVDDTGKIIAQVDRNFQLPPKDDPRILRYMEVYYLYDSEKQKVPTAVVTARGEFLE